MMFPSSLAVVVTGLLLGGISLAAFGWAWLRGQFNSLDVQSRAIFDERDCQLDRPWETPLQRAERRVGHGPLVEPTAGEWGGSQ